ncbi:Uncharacterised protein [Vibrio cholerae]|uniref:Uncharacterized protein n=1 Tax=Vibrio cholerae TaxID=666 RepID=A0A655Q0X6_VIBCL|nr:Uncharacterised protein [Vibrio cholerae]
MIWLQSVKVCDTACSVSMASPMHIFMVMPIFSMRNWLSLSSALPKKLLQPAFPLAIICSPISKRGACSCSLFTTSLPSI